MWRGYEHRKQPLLPSAQFYQRVLSHVLLATGFLAAALALGVVGYHITAGLSWLDSLLNASMLLGGMGPVSPIETTAGKWFASIYALFSGVVFLVIASIIVAPVAHRLLHRMHLEESSND